jgi:hypothetical protein
MVLAVSVMILLLGCGDARVKPVSTEKELYDTATASEILNRLEHPMLIIPTPASITRTEFLKLQEQYPVFSKDDGNLLSTFVSANDLEDKSKQILRMVKENFVPTYLHQGIEITAAYTETILYKEAYSRRNSRTLYIEIKYYGNDEKLKYFWRTYRFTMEKDGDRVYTGFSGIANYSGEGFSRDYLPLK